MLCVMSFCFGVWAGRDDNSLSSRHLDALRAHVVLRITHRRESAFLEWFAEKASMLPSFEASSPWLGGLTAILGLPMPAIAA